MLAVDMDRERAQARFRQAKQIVRARALVVLGKAGHMASLAELREAVDADLAYGHLPGIDRNRILRCALAMQRLDMVVSTRIRPGHPRFAALAVSVRPPAPEPKRETSVSAEKPFGWLPPAVSAPATTPKPKPAPREKAPPSAQRSKPARVRKAAAPKAAPKPRPAPKPKAVKRGPRPPRLPERTQLLIKVFMVRRLHADPSLRTKDLHAEVCREFEVAPTLSNFESWYMAPVRKALGIVMQRGRWREKKGAARAS